MQVFKAVVLGLLLAGFVPSALAQSPTDHTLQSERHRALLLQRGSKALVRLTLRDGTRIQGALESVQDKEAVLHVHARNSGTSSRVVLFSDIKHVKFGRSFGSRLKEGLCNAIAYPLFFGIVIPVAIITAPFRK